MQWLGFRYQSEGCINDECQDQKFENASPDVSDVFHFETVLHKGLVISVYPTYVQIGFACCISS